MIDKNPLKQVAIVIPAFNPDKKLIILINELILCGAENIIVVNDGSDAHCEGTFEIIKTFDQCEILTHAVNLGKGRALKTAFNHFINHYKELIGLVTVDADGQHKCEDITKVAQVLQRYPDNLILGSRSFDSSDVPFTNKCGNKITSKVFGFFSGINITDTQTGLRGISYKDVLSMLKVKGERYDYEMNMLLECAQKSIEIREVHIETVYIEGNRSSHFNPFVDSIKIYVVFLKFLFSSFSSFIVDILSFVIFTKIFFLIIPSYFIFLATIGSRVLSSAFNYTVNRKAVFSFKGYKGNTVTKYYILSIVQMCISAIGVSLLYNQFHQGEVLIKMVVDGLLFIFSFRIQRDWVFVVDNKINSL